MKDPRDTLENRAIRHAAMLQRYEAGEVRRILAFYDRELIPDVLAVLDRRMAKIDERGFDLGPWTTARLGALHKEVGLVVHRGMKVISKATKKGLIELVGQEAVFQAASINASLSGIPVATVVPKATMPPAKLMKSIVTERPFEGRVLGEWFEKQEGGLKDKLRTELRLGLAQSETTPQLRNRVLGAMNGSKRDAEAVVLTATSHVTNQAAMEGIRANPDIYKGWKFLATLDQKTTLECAGLDGEKFALDDDSKVPPRHWRCRSRAVGDLKSYKDLGLDIPDTPPPSRAAATGPVKGGTTYQGWLEKMDADPETRHYVEDALGPRRAKLWRGGLNVKKFTGPTGDTLTLAELARREGG